jgi:hypothetical protein
MKNILIAIIIFSSLLGFVYYADYALIKLCDDITYSTDKITISIEEGNWNDAYEDSTILIELIEENSLIVSVYINHNDFDNLQDEALQLSIYTSCKNTMESLVSVNTLKNSALNLISLHKTNIKNIF